MIQIQAAFTRSIRFWRHALLCSIADNLCSIILRRSGDNWSCNSATSGRNWIIAGKNQSKRHLRKIMWAQSLVTCFLIMQGNKKASFFPLVSSAQNRNFNITMGPKLLGKLIIIGTAISGSSKNVQNWHFDQSRECITIRQLKLNSWQDIN